MKYKLGSAKPFSESWFPKGKKDWNSQMEPLQAMIFPLKCDGQWT